MQKYSDAKAVDTENMEPEALAPLMTSLILGTCRLEKTSLG